MTTPAIEFELDGVGVTISDPGISLLAALRDHLGVLSAKDGCSPQGQCGCCTVLVDGRPRVACVTPVSRVRGRTVTSVDGLADAQPLVDAFVATGASQCGFCTPGIIVRLAALDPAQLGDRDTIDRALLAHVCRCTGWQTIREAAVSVAARHGDGADRDAPPAAVPATKRDLEAASRRAEIEGRVPQQVGPDVVLGRGGFSDDLAPRDALVAVPSDSEEGWAVAESLEAARALAGVVPGRRTTAPVTWPVPVPDGEWFRSLQTTWVEPAYLEPDSAWCAPGGAPTSPLGNAGAFGAKSSSPVAEAARMLADRHGRTVRVLMSREDTVRMGPKRPPLSIGVQRDGTGVVRVVDPGDDPARQELRAAIAAVAPQVSVEFVEVPGPPVSAAIRAAGWAEVAAAISSLGEGPDVVVAPDGAQARCTARDDGSLSISVSCGDPLDETVLRSYCIGAAHMALGMVRSEAISVDDDGIPHDLTMRSFGILRAVDTPLIDVTIEAPAPDGGTCAEAVNGSDAVFAAVLAAAWREAGHPLRLPVG